MSLAGRALPLGLPERLSPARSVLVVVDMQNDFCAEGGYIDRTMGKDVSAGAAILPQVQALVRGAREAGVPVLWLRADYSHDRIPDSMALKLAARGIEAECCKPGTWGFDWFGGLSPQAEEAVVTKHSYSGFIGTDMQAQLARLGRRTLVFCGVQTQVCVESTLRDAHAHGYFCFAVQDAVGSHTPALHAATLDNVRFLFGDVCSSAEVLSAWQAPSNTDSRAPSR
ncbi:cysteine hydrolase family protein [Ramlibacter rhizophilus]|uniref:Cysteine hydrolase n=1 Tax=Ramlibacter rhizophilus TaxID=1781167 RepID=A0A4Z0BDS1_9BURK|nr:isochorismatase family cysteine hydrolase [Ramlibacter rhizophilus]TFY97432.1 cysteine hydrolase [Ramlibacter rhizophilus]